MLPLMDVRRALNLCVDAAVAGDSVALAVFEAALSGSATRELSKASSVSFAGSPGGCPLHGG